MSLIPEIEIFCPQAIISLEFECTLALIINSYPSDTSARDSVLNELVILTTS